jgi:hypothetical protein
MKCDTCHIIRATFVACQALLEVSKAPVEMVVVDQCCLTRVGDRRCNGNVYGLHSNPTLRPLTPNTHNIGKRYADGELKIS